MRRNLWVIVATVAIGVLLTSSIAYAGTIVKPNAPKSSLRQIYDRTRILDYDEGPVKLPRPVGGPAATSSTASTSQSSEFLAGPVAAGIESTTLGVAMAQPRGGGSIYTGQQQADREIKKLIRRLN